MQKWSNALESRQPTLQEIEQMAMQMAHALRDLHCPDQCGRIHRFIEDGAPIYREELEWACFAIALRKCRRTRPRS